MANVVVGDGEMGNSWIVVRGYGADGGKLYDNPERFSISQNGKSYHISNWFLDMDAIVGKNTPQGQHIANMIEQENFMPNVKEWITNNLLHLVNPTDLRHRINHAISQAEKKGRRQKRNEILEVLGCD